MNDLRKIARQVRVWSERIADTPWALKNCVAMTDLTGFCTHAALELFRRLRRAGLDPVLALSYGWTGDEAHCFVICSGENERQLRAIQQDVMEQLEEDGSNPRRIEGTPASGWILIDYGDVVVHIFDVDQRTFYRLEDIWKDAPTLLAIQ